MGRGRAKAKQTKVARELKYSAPDMDLARLQRDLHTGDPLLGKPRVSESSDFDELDPADEESSYFDDEDEDSSAGSATR